MKPWKPESSGGKMTPEQHQCLLDGVLKLLDEFQWNDLGPSILDSLREGIKIWTGEDWTPCEERMPTKEDGDKWGNVLWGNNWDHSPVVNAPWCNPMAKVVWSHWMPPPHKPL